MITPKAYTLWKLYFVCSFGHGHRDVITMQRWLPLINSTFWLFSGSILFLTVHPLFEGFILCISFGLANRDVITFQRWLLMINSTFWLFSYSIWFLTLHPLFESFILIVCFGLGYCDVITIQRWSPIINYFLIVFPIRSDYSQGIHSLKVVFCVFVRSWAPWCNNNPTMITLD